MGHKKDDYNDLKTYTVEKVGRFSGLGLITQDQNEGEKKSDEKSGATLHTKPSFGLSYLPRLFQLMKHWEENGGLGWDVGDGGM